MASTLCQKWFKKNVVFLSKSSTFRVVWTIQLCSNFTGMWYKHFSRNVWRDFRLSMSALASVARKSFNGKFTAKIGFPIGHFMLPLLMLKLEVLSLSIQLFDKYLDHMLVEYEQNRMFRTKQNFVFFTKND